EATLVSRQRSVEAAAAGAQEIQTQIDDCFLKAPTVGRVLYRLAEPGEVLSAGGKVLTLVNLADVYMEIFLPAAQAHRVSIGSPARIKLDILDFAVPATVSFVSPESQFTPKQVETHSEREKLMFRVKVRVPQKLILKHIDRVKTGVRGMAYVQVAVPGKPAGKTEWPEFLQKLPPGIDDTLSNK
ncbi:MAG TPA: HlyD family efflux transporter periplasmic adaptor subunit, partial [Hyphomicrobiaceae bacterium]|nr:HlyD family efflux transporter periplasmic adaptor subunit [Hyphomicrobiaceae bacterium]